MLHRCKLLGFFLLLSAPLYAQVAVRINRPSTLFSKPSENSAPLSQIGGGTGFRALEQSADHRWVFVSDGLRFGWVRKIFVTVQDETAATLSAAETPLVGAPGADEELHEFKPKKKTSLYSKSGGDSDEDAAAPDDEEGDDEDIENVTPKKERIGRTFTVKKAGPLYEEPKKGATRFGMMEIDDEVKFIETSDDGVWAHVRLNETGEEGWVLRSHLGRRVYSQGIADEYASSRMNLNHIGLYGTYAGIPWGFGGMLSYRRGIDDLVMLGAPIEIGLSVGYEAGTTESYIVNSVLQQVKASYLDVRGFIRWEPRVYNDFWIPIEGGIVYKHGTIQTNLTSAQFQALDSNIKASDVGGYIGAGVSYHYSNAFQIEAMPILQVMASAATITGTAGIVFSF